MSEMDDKKRENAEQLNYMSTEELEELLKTYSQSSEDADVAFIFSILEVIEKREKRNPSGKYTDTDTAWASFQKNYRPARTAAESLYDFAEDMQDNTILHSDIKEPKEIYANRHGRRSIRHKVFLRMVGVLVSLIIVLLSSTMVAKALGFDLWEAVAKWTKDTFGFSISVSDTQESHDSNGQIIYKSLQDTLDNYNITTKLAPTWLPDGYILKTINVNETPAQTRITAGFLANDGEISITIISFANMQSHAYEKDDNNITLYSKQGTDYYIMSNIDRSNIVWQVENYECSISGIFSLDAAKQIIDSIYERKST